MELVERALWKVKRVLALTSLCYTFINALIVLLAGSLLLALFSLSWLLALIPAGIYFISAQRKRYKRLGFGDVEEKIPELEWRLRTSADNKHRSDELASSLHREVMQRIGLVKVSTFLTSKHVLYKFATVLGLFLLMIFVQTQDVTLESLGSKITDPSVTGFFSKDTFNFSQYFGEDATEEDIYGEKADPLYGNKEELLELSQMQGLVDPSQAGKGKGKEFTQQSTGIGEQALGGANSQEKIDEKDKNIIQNYFQKINQK